MILKPRPFRKPNLGHPLMKGCKGMWLFNESPPLLGTAFDLSGNGNHGTLVGNTHSVAANFGNGVVTDGSGDYVDLDTQLGKPQRWTIAGWIKPIAYDQGGIFASLSSGGSLAWGVWNDPPVVKMAVSHATGGQVLTVENYNSTNYPLDKWTFIAATVDGTTQTFYRNGVYVNSVAQDRQNIGTAYKVRMGRFGELASGWDTTINIDHFLFWDRGLSASEVASLYKDPFQMFRTQPIELLVGANEGGAPATEDGQVIMILLG